MDAEKNDDDDDDDDGKDDESNDDDGCDSKEKTMTMKTNITSLSSLRIMLMMVATERKR